MPERGSPILDALAPLSDPDHPARRVTAPLPGVTGALQDDPLTETGDRETAITRMPVGVRFPSRTARHAQPLLPHATSCRSRVVATRLGTITPYKACRALHTYNSKPIAESLFGSTIERDGLFTFVGCTNER